MTRHISDMPLAAELVQKAPDDEIDLSALIGTLWRGRLWIMLCALMGLLLAGYYAFGVATPVYTTNATVALESRQEQIVDIESVMSGLTGDQVTINTEVEVLRSRRLIGKVVDDLNLVADPEFNVTLQPESWLAPSVITTFIAERVFGQDQQSDPRSERAIRDAVVNALLKRVTITNVRQSYVFDIEVVTENAAKSALIANRLAELYVEDQILLKFEKTAEATEWLTDRVGELQMELEASESALKTFSSDTNLISPEQLLALNRQLKDLRDRHADAAAAAMAGQVVLTRLEAARATNDMQQMADAAGDPALSRMLVGVPPAQVRVRFMTAFDAYITRTARDIARNQDQQQAVATLIGQISENIETQSDELVQLQQLQREAEANRLIYEFFLARLKETAVQQGLQQAESRILSYAVEPVEASAPRKLVVITLGLLLGAILGAALLLLREAAQNTFRTAADLEAKTGLPVLGQIPLVPARSRRKLLHYLQSKPNSAVAESIRHLRTSLLLANLDKHPKVIMSTSSVPGEGKTTQSISLALNLAGLDAKVLLIEGDIRRRVMNTYFGLPEKQGFLSVMLGDASLSDAVTKVPGMHFDVLFGETSQTNAADIFSSDRFRTFLSMLRERYDYIIIDTPPVLAVSDARIIGRWVDTIIYTVKWDHTTERQVLDGLRAFEQVQIKVSGLVLGQISPRGMKRYGYGDSYGAYQTYYEA